LPVLSLCVSTVLLHLAEETISQDSCLGLSYLLALPNVSTDVCVDYTFSNATDAVW